MRLRADCETVLKRLDEDEGDDVSLTVKIGDLCDALDAELQRVASQNRERPRQEPQGLTRASRKPRHRNRAEAHVPAVDRFRPAPETTSIMNGQT